jgi:RNA polymerase sigma-70 factor (ECF subfamily)
MTSGPRRPEVFEACRAQLVALAYRMLGDLSRAEDLVQETWLRWREHEGEVEQPRSFLITIVTRLCLNELGSAKVRHEESRSDRLPEPIDLEESALEQSERMEHVSMAFLVALQRLTPSERAVLLLHEVLEFEHEEIARLLGIAVPASRKALERARRNLANERRMLLTSPEEHRRLLETFLRAVSGGDVQQIVQLLADDAVLVTDGGARGRTFQGFRNLSQPVPGPARIAAFLVAINARIANVLQAEMRDLNGQPAIVFRSGQQTIGALLLAIADGRIARVFFHGDLDRLGHVGPATA